MKPDRVLLMALTPPHLRTLERAITIARREAGDWSDVELQVLDNLERSLYTSDRMELTRRVAHTD
jgi:hypothetical protein